LGDVGGATGFSAAVDACDNPERAIASGIKNFRLAIGFSLRMLSSCNDKNHVPNQEKRQELNRIEISLLNHALVEPYWSKLLMAASKLNHLKGVLDVARVVVEIVALIIAGLWAYSKFLEGERPSLEVRGHTESTLKWFTTLDASYCLGQFGVSLRNIGRTSFDVNASRLRVWLVAAPMATSEIEYLDPSRFQDGMPSLDKELKTGGLVLHYPPEVASQYDYVFFVRRDKSTIALVRLDASTADGQLFSESRWAETCGPLRRLSRKY